MSNINKPPLDIIETDGSCNQKCSYNFSYKKTGLTASNMCTYMEIQFTTINNNDTTFNTTKFTSKKMIIYQPSLHKFNGKAADAELVIHHTNNQKNLLVCIPIMSNNVSNTLIDKLIRQLSQLANSPCPKTTTSQFAYENVLLNNSIQFNLYNIIPNGGFNSYPGTLPYYPYSKSDIIVYSISNPIIISKTNLATLQSIIKIHKNNAIQGISFYNSMGANIINTDNNIYINCNPTDHSGNIIRTSGKNFTVNTTNMYNWLIPILGIIIIFLFVYLIKIKLGGLFDSANSSPINGNS
jgi:carbonic anhydrase